MNRKLVSQLIVILLLIGNVSAQYCTNDSRFSEAPYFNLGQITTNTNVEYGQSIDFQGNIDTLLFDIYYPNLSIDTLAKRPFIMLFHGGGFLNGSKQLGDIRDLCIHLAMRGFVCASVNYRLGYDFTEYGQIEARYRALQDGHAAFRYIVANANTIRIDTNWLFVGGQSAGSSIAHGLIYADQSELDSISLLYNSNSLSTDLGDLHNSGNTLTNTYSIKGLFNNWGAAVDGELEIDEMVPTIAFHGKLDNTVFIDTNGSFLHYSLYGSKAMHTILVANDICSELTVDTLGGHGIFRNASSVFRAQRASCFFKSVFCNSCSDFYTLDSVPPNCSSSTNSIEFPLKNQFKVYPNPFESTFNIEGTEGLLQLNLYNSMGQLIISSASIEQLNLLELQSGIYYLKIELIETGKTETLKLVKK